MITHSDDLSPLNTFKQNGKYASLLTSRPLKSTHLRDIARKQCPADFFNK